MGGGMSGTLKSVDWDRAGTPALWAEVDSLRADKVTLLDALRDAQSVLAILIDPDSQHVSSLHVFAQATAAEAKVRAALIAAGAK